MSNRVVNLADFKALFRRWADTVVKGFQDLREMSPIPEELKPGQKLQQ
jgi:hypothetical protein